MSSLEVFIWLFFSLNLFCNSLVYSYLTLLLILFVRYCFIKLFLVNAGIPISNSVMLYDIA